MELYFWLSRDWHWCPSRAQHSFHVLEFVISVRFFPYIFQSRETYFLIVSIRSLTAIGSGGECGLFAASLAAESASSLPIMLWSDGVHINLKLNF